MYPIRSNQHQSFLGEEIRVSTIKTQTPKVYIPLHKRINEKKGITYKGSSPPMEMSSNHKLFSEILIISDKGVEENWKECSELGVYAY